MIGHQSPEAHLFLKLDIVETWKNTAMPAATNKADLIAVTLKEYDKLVPLLDRFDNDLAEKVDPDQDCSAKEILAHRAHWIGLFLSWYQDGLAGLDVKTPAPGYKWNQLKPYNAFIYRTSRAFDWQDVRDDFARKHDALMAFLDEMPDDRLYQTRLYPWMNNWTLGRWCEASGSSHYRSATKVLHKILKALDPSTS